MSDPKYGEPVDEPTHADAPVQDVVGSANEGLADAEAASRDAVYGSEDGDLSYIEAAGLEPEPEPAPVTPAEPVVAEDAAPAAAEPVAEPEPVVAAEPVTTAEPVAAQPVTTVDAVAAQPVVVAPVAEPAAAPVAEAPAPAPQPIFVQAPEAPRPRGNRAAAGAIGLLAAIVFGILYLVAALGFGAIEGDVDAAEAGNDAVAALTSWWFWVPVAVFFLGFWLLGAIINRARWGYWVVFGILVGAVAYGGHLLGQLFEAPFWTLTASEGAALVQDQLLAPLAIAAFVFGREITIWFGAWVAARGKRISELNYEAQREYERTLEAGPQLHQG